MDGFMNIDFVFLLFARIFFPLRSYIVLAQDKSLILQYGALQRMTQKNHAALSAENTI